MITFKALNTADEWAWMRFRAAPIAVEDSQGIVAYDEKGDIKACCVADSFTVDACNVHIAIDTPLVLKYGFLQEVLRHLFVVAGRKRLFGLVPANNEKALKFDRHIGFQEVARIPHGFAEGVDYVVMCMERAACRWISELEEAA